MKTTLAKHATSAEITVTLNKADLEAARLKALTHLATNLKIAGFRKGKAPANVVEKHVDANDLASKTLDMAIRTILPRAFADQAIQPLSIPHVDVHKYVPGEMAELIVNSDIMPEIKLGNWRSLKSTKPVYKTQPSDITDVVNRIASSFAEKKVARRPAQLTDEVIMDFVGKKDGVAFDGGSAKDYSLELGSNNFIPGFESGLVGHSSGDKVTLNLTFPEDYHNPNLAGAPVVFEVLIKQVNSVTTPAIDDALAAKAGAFKTLKELKSDIKKNLQAQNDHRATENYKDSLILELVEESQVEAPASIVTDQAKYVREDFERNLKSRGLSLDQYLLETKKSLPDWEQETLQVAISRVKIMLVLHQLASEFKITVSDQEVAKKLAELKTVYQKDPAAAKHLESDGVIADIKNRLQIEKTLDALAKANH